MKLTSEEFGMARKRRPLQAGGARIETSPTIAPETFPVSRPLQAGGARIETMKRTMNFGAVIVAPSKRGGRGLKQLHL